MPYSEEFQIGMPFSQQEAQDCTIAAGMCGALGVGLLELARRSANAGHNLRAGTLAASAILPTALAFRTARQAIDYSHETRFLDQMPVVGKNGGAIGTHF